MSFTLQVSLIIVSRDRPRGLYRLLQALKFQRYTDFEVIIVSNLVDWNDFADLAGFKNLRRIHFDEANISKARNLGIQAAAGDILVFCDDDAVPEPTWLTHLIEPFAAKDVGISGGYVRGRNGISFQWRRIFSNAFGDDVIQEDTDELPPHTYEYQKDNFAKVQGTNCAFRKIALLDAGGFDPKFSFFLDEVDATLRLGRMGWKTAIVPLAQVQHGFEESARRTRNRVPKTLFNEGQSKSYFIARHAAALNPEQSIRKFMGTQKNRLVQLMLAGWLEPGDVTRLMASLVAGLDQQTDAGKDMTLEPLSRSKQKFTPYQQNTQSGPGDGLAIAGSSLNWWRMCKVAQAEANLGNIVTIFRFSRTALFHHSYFDQRGFWVQFGGLFGPSSRNDPKFKFWTLPSRIHKEITRISMHRQLAKRLVWRFGAARISK